MAKLSQFKVNSQEVQEGCWVRVAEEYDDLEIRTRGFTDAYHDARSAKMRRAAMRYSGNVERVPTSVSREITIICLIEHIILDVRNIVDDAGKPVDFSQFCVMLHNPDYSDLVVAALKAAAIVGMAKSEDLEDATKN